VEIDLRQVIRALLRWGWTIVLLSLLGGGAGYGLASLQTPTYSATTSLLVTTPLSSTLIDGGSRAETYRNLVESGPVLDRVILELGLGYDRRELAHNITTTVVTNTQIIQITVEDDDPGRAADIANSTARNFVSQVATLTVGQLEQTLSELQAESDALSARLDEIDAQVAELDDGATEVNALQAERLRVAQTIADLDSSIRSINEQLVTSTTPVAVADAAVVSEDPDSPRPLLIGILGVFLGGLIGLGLVAILEFMDTKLRSDDNVEELTGARLLTTVPMTGVSSPDGLVAVHQPDSTTTESIRMLRAHLAGQIARGGRNVLVFTSARGEAPVSQVVGNLGVLLAQSGIKTMIVDVDLRDPMQHRLFGLPSANGLGTLLSGDDSSVAVASGTENLEVTPAGEPTRNPSELIGSARFAEYVATARAEAGVVLIDSPAMLVHSEALSAAAIADGIVLVAREGQTDRGDLQAAAEMAEADGLPLIGTVVAHP
jgi:polysaccharide biosynthesis transport protein